MEQQDGWNDALGHGLVKVRFWNSNQHEYGLAVADEYRDVGHAVYWPNVEARARPSCQCWPFHASQQEEQARKHRLSLQSSVREVLA